MTPDGRVEGEDQAMTNALSEVDSASARENRQWTEIANASSAFGRYCLAEPSVKDFF
jgi:hypothetical protein